MSSNQQELPTDNDGWFKRHIIDALNNLKEGQEELSHNQRVMHDQNIERIDAMAQTIRDHEKEDTKNFDKVNGSLQDLMPLKKIVYGVVAMILVAFGAAWIGSVIVSQRPVVVAPASPSLTAPR
jgi:hypothetical protein